MFFYGISIKNFKVDIWPNDLYLSLIFYPSWLKFIDGVILVDASIALMYIFAPKSSWKKNWKIKNSFAQAKTEAKIVRVGPK